LVLTGSRRLQLHLPQTSTSFIVIKCKRAEIHPV
jgi:hypothetical protein